jgi:thiamine-phosphate pyrophosphorylase
VHLGQDDLKKFDPAALQRSGIRLGISTHSWAEAARAHAWQPSYVALGPIFPTQLKAMPFSPQGESTLRVWRQIFDIPLVAIGGITLEQGAALYDAGADSIAVVSDVLQHALPLDRVRAWLAL